MICQNVWPAAAMKSTKRRDSLPKSPMPNGPGREVGCRRTPLDRSNLTGCWAARRSWAVVAKNCARRSMGGQHGPSSRILRFVARLVPVRSKDNHRPLDGLQHTHRRPTAEAGRFYQVHNYGRYTDTRGILNRGRRLDPKSLEEHAATLVAGKGMQRGDGEERGARGRSGLRVLTHEGLGAAPGVGR